MPIFLGVHKMPDVEGVEELANKSWEKYKSEAESMGLKPIMALVNFEKGVAYCQTEASTKEEVEEAHNKAEVPFEEVIEMKKLA